LKAALAVACLLCLTFAHAAAEDDRAERALRGGATSFEAGVSTLFGEATGVIAVRRHLSPAWALRAGVAVSTDNRDSDGGDGFDTGTAFNSSRSTHSDYDLTLQAMAYPVRSGNLALMFAAGPSYGRTHDTRHDVSRYPNGSVQLRTRERESRLRVYGATLAAGFEWFVDRRVALRAHSHAQYEWTKGSETSLDREIDFAGNVDSQFGSADEFHGTRFRTITFGVALVGYF
jgi:hypothetical protein